MSSVIEKPLDAIFRDDIVTTHSRFRLHNDIECGDCDGDGGIEIDTTRAIHWEPQSVFVECESCEGTGHLPETPDVFIQRAIDGRPQLIETPKQVIAAMVAMAQRLDESEEFEIETKRNVALSLGYRVPAGRYARDCNELDRE